MRTYFEPEDIEAFETAKDLLIRRCVSWAKSEGFQLDPLALSAALDFRHHSIDGRLNYWTTGLAEEFLLSQLPRVLSGTAQESAAMPESLRLFLRYLHTTGLADPTGAPLADLDAAITKATPEFPAAMADERKFGVTKFWVMNARRAGLDPTDNAVMSRFLDDARAGRVDYDQDVLNEITARHFSENGGRPERAMPHLPVSLVPEAELAATAEQTTIVAWLRALVDWVGDGRALTPNGNFKLADARELVALLDTGDELDPSIGDRVYRTKSSTELPVLTTLAEVAKKIRVVRVVKGKLTRVAKNARLLQDGLALWTAAFNSLPSIDLVTQGLQSAPEYAFLLDDMVEELLPDLLNTLYGLPEPVPVVRLQETAWLSFSETFYLDEISELIRTTWRSGVSFEVRRLFVTLATFGAAELITADPDPIYRADLDIAEFPPDMRERLRAALSAGPIELVSLTPLAMKAVHDRLVATGRHAPVIGELVDAEPAPLLGLLSEHYTEDAAKAELAGWLANHGGRERGLAQLLDAIRACPFRTRAAAMLNMLTYSVPDRSTFLWELRDDRQLGPMVTNMLLGDGRLTLEELDEKQHLRGMADQFIQMLELGGPDEGAHLLTQVPSGMLTDLLSSDHPDKTGMAELRELSAARSGLATVHPLAGISRPDKGRRKGRKRRR